MRPLINETSVLIRRDRDTVPHKGRSRHVQAGQRELRKNQHAATGSGLDLGFWSFEAEFVLLFVTSSWAFSRTLCVR